MKKSIYSTEQSVVVEKLVTARKKAGLTQTDVANELGRTQSFLAKIESGQRRVDVVLLKELARIYKVSVSEFI